MFSGLTSNVTLNLILPPKPATESSPAAPVATDDLDTTTGDNEDDDATEDAVMDEAFDVADPAVRRSERNAAMAAAEARLRVQEDHVMEDDGHRVDDHDDDGTHVDEDPARPNRNALMTAVLARFQRAQTTADAEPELPITPPKRRRPTIEIKPLRERCLQMTAGTVGLGVVYS